MAQAGNILAVRIETLLRLLDIRLGAPADEARGDEIRLVQRPLGIVRRGGLAGRNPRADEDHVSRKGDADLTSESLEIALEGNGQVAPRAVAREGDVLGRDAHGTDQVEIAAQTILQTCGERVSSLVAGQAILRREYGIEFPMLEQRLAQEARGRRPAIANHKRAAVQVQHHIVQALRTARRAVHAVPRATRGRGPDLFADQGTDVDRRLERLNGRPSRAFFSRLERERFGDADAALLIYHDLDQVAHQGLLERPFCMRTQTWDRGSYHPDGQTCEEGRDSEEAIYEAEGEIRLDRKRQRARSRGRHGRWIRVDRFPKVSTWERSDAQMLGMLRFCCS